MAARTRRYDDLKLALGAEETPHTTDGAAEPGAAACSRAAAAITSKRMVAARIASMLALQSASRFLLPHL